MAWADAYATDAEYRARVGDNSSGVDTTLDSILLTASRLVEQRLGRVFNQSTADQARYFEGVGHEGFDPYGDRARKLAIDDLVSLAATTPIAVDLAMDGTYSTTFAASTWAVLTPFNAALQPEPEPYTHIELLRRGSPTLAYWPRVPRVVRVTGTWGWPAVPGAIKELTIQIAHRIKQAHDAGSSGEIPTFEGGSAIIGEADWRLWRDIEMRYSRRVPAVA